MNRLAIVSLAAIALAGVSACSEQTQQDAARTADLAEDDAQANLQVAGEAIEEGAIEASDAVSEGAANLRDNLEAGDTEEAGPAPITGGEPARD